jgi:hypothetical protein
MWQVMNLLFLLSRFLCITLLVLLDKKKKKKEDIMLHIPNSWEKIPRTYNEKLPLVL